MALPKSVVDFCYRCNAVKTLIYDKDTIAEDIGLYRCSNCRTPRGVLITPQHRRFAELEEDK